MAKFYLYSRFPSANDDGSAVDEGELNILNYINDWNQIK